MARGNYSIGPDGTIYAEDAVAPAGHIYAINPDGTSKWTFTTIEALTGPPTVSADGIVYAGDAYGNLYAVGPDGTELWTYPSYRYPTSSPAIGADGTLYFTLSQYFSPTGLHAALYAIGNVPPVNAKVVISPRSVAFGRIRVGATRERKVRVKAKKSNKGPVLIKSISLSGSGYAVDGLRSTCGRLGSLAPGKSCVFAIQFTPSNATAGQALLGQLALKTTAESETPQDGKILFKGGGKLRR
ncbi:MAG: PQQ-binding-like beta-propeller repeat protein [Candidatus Binataceae bacterium]